jgi:putative endopeptidase
MVKTRKHKKNNNKSKKMVPTYKESRIVCRNAANTFNSFEEEYEKKFKNSLKKEDTKIEESLVKLFKTPFTPSKYTAQNDFYTWINYEWLKKTGEESNKNKKFYVQVDSFRVTQEKVYYELIDIVKDYIKKNDTNKSIALNNLYKSLLTLDDESAANYVKWATIRVDQIIESNNLYRMLAEINQNEIISWGSPIVWSVLADQKDSKVYRSTISAPQLTAYDYTLYIEDETEDEDTKKYKKEFKQAYFKYLDDMFDACLGKGHELKASDVWDVEYDMLTSLGCISIKNDDEDGYNVVTIDESQKYGLDWSLLAKEIGYKKVPKKYICTSLNYVKCVMKLLTKDDAWKTKKWRTYYLYIVFRQLIRFHSKWLMIHYEFKGKFINGQPVPWPRELYPVFGLSICFNTLLSNEYIAKNKREENITYVKNMAKDLLIVFKRIIKRNTWLSPETKKYALLKLENINLIVGSPDVLYVDPILSYDSKNAYQNLKKIAVWRTKRFIALDGKAVTYDIPLIDWDKFKLIGKQPYIVNAYYTPIENSIYVPLAYLQKPFIDLDERGIEYNLAFVGYTLSHEMSHSLDDLGSKYDYKGNLYDWWTKEDRRQFNLKVKNVIKQYETFALYDGIKMDASLSTGENLADISGLAICMEYLRDFQDNNDDIVPIRALSFKSFFIYMAIQARQKIYTDAIKAQLKTNPHPMDKYRTNCPLARLELFRSIYNIKKGDKMFWQSTDTIW